MDYGRAIRIARAVRGLSQKQLAELIDSDASYISLIEAGLRVPRPKTLERISKKVGVPLHLLMLFASEKRDLRGLSPNQAGLIARQLLEALLQGERSTA
ncbi:MAG: helix-turn-helix domain-containing protein [Nitrospiraceae bacterium]